MTTASEATDQSLIPKKRGFLPVWLHFGFKLSSKDESTPVCRLCGKEISVKCGNTSNLFSHLKNKHPYQYAETKARTENPSKDKPGSASVQVNIKELFESGQPYYRTSKRWQTLTDSVSYAIAKRTCSHLELLKGPASRRCSPLLNQGMSYQAENIFPKLEYLVFTIQSKAL